MKTTTNKKLKIGIKVNNKTYWINSEMWELLSELFKISIAQENPQLYHEIKAYKGVGKKGNISHLLAEALTKPINYPNNNYDRH
jgi:hypothetical protein